MAAIPTRLAAAAASSPNSWEVERSRHRGTLQRACFREGRLWWQRRQPRRRGLPTDRPSEMPCLRLNRRQVGWERVCVWGLFALSLTLSDSNRLHHRWVAPVTCTREDSRTETPTRGRTTLEGRRSIVTEERRNREGSILSSTTERGGRETLSSKHLVV